MRKLTTLLVIALFGNILASECARAAKAEVVERLKEKTTEERVYRLDTEIELILDKEQAIRLKIEDNPYGLSECIVGNTSEFDDKQILFVYWTWPDGRISGGGSDLTKIVGALKQAGDAPCLAVATWTVEDGAVTTRFRALTDQAEIRRAYEEYLTAGKNGERWSIQFHDYEALFGAQGKPVLQLDYQERLAGFVHLWSEVKYNFAFFDQVPDLDWDDVLVEYLPQIEREQTGLQYYRLLERCIALLQDGHTNVYGREQFYPHGLDSPALRIQPAEGKAIIAEVGTSQELLDAELRAGDEVTHVNGRAVKKLLEEDLYPYIAASTPQDRDRKAYRELLEGPRGTELSIRVRGMDGSTRDVTLIRRSKWEEMPWTASRDNLEFREMPGGIVYVALNTFGRSDIAEAFTGILDKVQRAKGLILDVRKNGGGSTNNGYAIISHLIDKPVRGSKWKTRQYMPAFRAWGNEERWYEGDPSIIKPARTGAPYLGPVVVLIGPQTVSAAEDFVVALHAADRATLVGEKTAGTTGQPLVIDLPGGSARICTKWDT